MDDVLMKQRARVLVVCLVGQDLSEVWWSSANKAFDTLTPNDQWEQDPTIVYRYLMSHIGGW